MNTTVVLIYSSRITEKPLINCIFSLLLAERRPSTNDFFSETGGKDQDGGGRIFAYVVILHASQLPFTGKVNKMKSHNFSFCF